MGARKLAPLGKAALAVADYLEKTGDSISALIAGDDHYFAFTASGLPVRPADVLELKAHGRLVPFGRQIDPLGEAACYVLAGSDPAPASTACGAKSIRDCTARGFCIDCAPARVARDVRKGRSAVAWHGAAP